MGSGLNLTSTLRQNWLFNMCHRNTHLCVLLLLTCLLVSIKVFLKSKLGISFFVTCLEQTPGKLEVCSDSKFFLLSLKAFMIAAPLFFNFNMEWHILAFLFYPPILLLFKIIFTCYITLFFFYSCVFMSFVKHFELPSAWMCNKNKVCFWNRM